MKRLRKSEKKAQRKRAAMVLALKIMGLTTLVAIVVLVMMLIMSNPSSDSIEGRANQLAQQLNLATLTLEEQQNIVIEAGMGWSESEMANVLNALPYAVIRDHVGGLAGALDVMYPKWQYNMKGFTIDYLKQQKALNGLAEAKLDVGEAEAVITIQPKPLQTSGVLEALTKHMTADNSHATDDLYVDATSVAASWTSTQGVLSLNSLSFLCYNIVDNLHYKVVYADSLLTITPAAKKMLAYNDPQLSWYLDNSIDLLFANLVPMGIEVPVVIEYSNYNSNSAAEGKDLAKAFKSDVGYVPIDGAQQTYTKATGLVMLTWTTEEGLKNLSYELVE